MTLPTLDKTWQHDVNQELRGAGEPGGRTRRKMMLAIKNSLVSMPLSPWTVIGSSDAVVSAMDGVDRWVTDANVQFGDNTLDGQTGKSSWIVLQQTGLGPKFQLLLHCTYYSPSAGAVARISISPAAGYGTANGGTDGSLANNDWPTATDEIVIKTGSNSVWLESPSQQTSEQNFVLHVSQTDDGECTRINVFDLNFYRNCTIVFFEKAKSPIAEWTNPILFEWDVSGGQAERHTYVVWNDVATVKGLNPNGGTMTMYCTCEGYLAAMNPQNLTGVNDLTGDYEFYPMGLLSNTASARGRHGERYDIWWVSTSLINGVTVPLTPSPTREFNIFDDMLFPWDGTLPVLV